MWILIIIALGVGQAGEPSVATAPFADKLACLNAEFQIRAEVARSAAGHQKSLKTQCVQAGMATEK